MTVMLMLALPEWLTKVKTIADAAHMSENMHVSQACVRYSICGAVHACSIRSGLS